MSSTEASGLSAAVAVGSLEPETISEHMNTTVPLDNSGQQILQPKQVDTASVTPLDSRKRLAAAASAIVLPDIQKRVVMQLKEFQEEHLKFEEEYRQEWNQLKLKYLGKFRPLYLKRREILTCNKTEDTANITDSPTGTQSLPEFWVKAMKNHILLAEMIEEHDLPILAYLEDIVFDWVDPQEQASFKLEFYFAPNDYFKNKMLSKTYHLERAEDDDEESVLIKTTGTPIEWLPGKNVTEKTVTRKQRNKRTNQTRTITEVVEDNSFFNFFQSHEIPSEEQLENMDESEVTELEMIVEAEFEVGCILRDKIVPRALGWYLGIEKDDEAESLAASGGDDGEEFDDEDDDDELDDEDEE